MEIQDTGANLVKGSAGGERAKMDWYESGATPSSQAGYFEQIGNGAWELNRTNRPGTLENNTSQTWHTIEYRFKLATSTTAQDGEVDVWHDGIKQGPSTRIFGQGGAPSYSGIPTAVNGSGFNIQGWNNEWGQAGVDGFIYVNDVVVSTDRIGHDYVPGNRDNVP